ncbi:MAG: hypothetical protein ACI8QZ_001929 [Chlamydiales bacterium]|jgi:hypothetical protein
MVYAGKVEGDAVTLGVSGRLLEGNLIMWDSETNSLWSQISGEALHGDQSGKHLELVPSVFVDFGTWKKLHPKTQVLDLPPIERTAWHFTSHHMKSGKNERAEPLGIGARAWGDAVMVSIARLQREGVVQADVSEVPVAFVWDRRSSSALVYDRRLDGQVLDLAFKDGALVTKGGQRFDPVSGKTLEAEQTVRLKRFSYLPSVIKAWEEFFPGGKILQ